jgi:hypothetical protein
MARVNHAPALASSTKPPPPASTKEIRRRVRRQEVDQRASLDVYFRTAEHIALQVRARKYAPRIGCCCAHASRVVVLGAGTFGLANLIILVDSPSLSRRASHTQAKVFRAEDNFPQLYRLLYAYVSLVLDTMTEHADWTSSKYETRARREEARTRDALGEMETLAPVIDEAAESWRRLYGDNEIAIGAPPVRPPPISATRGGTHVEASPSGRLDVASNAAPTPAVGVTAAMERTSLNVSRPTEASLSKHSMFGAKLPSASETASAARAAAAQSSGRGDIDGPPLRTGATNIDNATTVSSSSSSVIGPVSSHLDAQVPPPSRAVVGASGSVNRHAHSLLPPPPPPPPSMAEDSFAQGIMYSAASVDFQPKVIVQVPTTDEADTDHSRLDTRLKLYGLREKVVRGDGNCQFRAIADQLFQDQERHAECRTVVINQLRRAAEDYAPYVPEDYDQYVQTMSLDTTWGDHITLQAAADAYGIAMCVISSYKDNFVVEIQPKIKRSARVCWISFWAEVHYNSIYPLSNPAAG